MSRYKKGLQISIGLISDCLWTQAYITAFNIGLNISSEARPIVFPADKVDDFIDAKMSCQRVIVIPTDELYLNNFRYKR